jgi:two-component system, LytTR family, sensor histidine kinase AlgZ
VGPRAEKIRRFLREDLWAYLAVPAFLTFFMAGFERTTTFIFTVKMFLVNTFIGASIGLTINALYCWPGAWIRYKERPAAIRWLIHGVFVPIGAVVGSLFALRAGAWFLPELGRLFPPLGVVRVALPVSIAVVAIAFGFDKLRTRAKEIELREERAKRELLSAQLEALKARTNPHFLFNSLNTVASLIEIDPVRAERAVEMLSSLFRYALDGSRTAAVPLSRELEAVEKYLAFEALRFGEKMRYQLIVEPGLENVQVLPLILQPLAENAVKHGIASRREGGRVRIEARREETSLILEVEDDGPGPETSKHRGSGTAQADLQARLELAYGSGAHLICRPGSNGGYLARLVMPLGSGAV